MNKKDEQEISDIVTQSQKDITGLYGNVTNVGTEEITQEDLNTPILKVVQSNTQNVEDKTEGKLYRSDTDEQLDEVAVSLVYVTTQEMENYNRTGIEKVKVYYGFYAGTNEPFKMFVRGWSLAMHREFQSEVGMWKNKLKVPMFALKVVLTTEKQQGTIKETGKPYTVYKLKFTVQKDKSGLPVVELDSNRIGFLHEAAKRFKEIAVATPSETDNKANDLPFG